MVSPLSNSIKTARRTTRFNSNQFNPSKMGLFKDGELIKIGWQCAHLMISFSIHSYSLANNFLADPQAFLIVVIRSFPKPIVDAGTGIQTKNICQINGIFLTIFDHHIGVGTGGCHGK